MDDAQCDMEQVWGESHRTVAEFIEARAAVAELVEALRDMQERAESNAASLADSEENEDAYSGFRRIATDSRAALAKFGGAK